MREIKININLNGRIHSVRIDSQYEHIIRQAAKRINERIAEFKNEYVVNDEAQVLSMLLLEEITQKAILENQLEKMKRKCEQEVKIIIEKLEE
jgi:cell division protein ZapA (FtsZ GTPase activity inhibitor)